MRARILIADDHDVIRRRISQLVESHDGWEVCAQVEDGKQAVLKTRELKPDIVILDLAMPVMNGVEAADEIRKTMPLIPVVLYTLYAFPAVESRAKEVGVRRVVQKPDVAGLLRVVKNLLEEPQSAVAD